MSQQVDLPERLYCYKGILNDGSRWDHFTARPDDVFVCTLGKNGTTWMQAICALLIFQKPELDFNPGIRSPWLDVTFVPIEEIIADLEAQTERRVIKTHTPLDGIPFFPECTYITVYRDPRDAFFSMRNHMDNMKMKIIEGEMPDPETAFRAWVEEDYEPGTSDVPSLAYAAHHLKGYLAYNHLPNIHVFHYADLKRDLLAGMGQVAEALGIEVEPSQLATLAQAASFSNMKKKADQFAPGANRDFWHDTGRFFHKGENEQWRNFLHKA